MRHFRSVSEGSETQRGLLAALLTLFLLLLFLPGTAGADIERVQSPQYCGQTTPKLDPGGRADVTIRGPWTDYASQVRCTSPGCGITGSVTRKGGGFSRQGPHAVLTLRAPANEQPGLKTLEVRMPKPLGGVETDTFRVRVASRLITRITAPRQDDFFTRVTLDVQGNDLPQTGTLSTSSHSTSGVLSVIPLTGVSGGSRLQGGASGGRVEAAQWRRINSRRGQITVRFADPMQLALLEVRMSPTRGCYVRGSNDAQVRVEARVQDARNFVQDIRSDRRNVYRPGSVLSFVVSLKERVGSSSTTSKLLRKGKPSRGSLRGETVYWRVSPAGAFRQANGVSPLPSLSRLVIPRGRQQGTIQFFVANCAGSERMNAILETFMHDTSASRAPERIAHRFRITCPRR